VATTELVQVTLPCRVENKVGFLQWTRDGFGLGETRHGFISIYFRNNKENTKIYVMESLKKTTF
jgi:hypothetical protein